MGADGVNGQLSLRSNELFLKRYGFTNLLFWLVMLIFIQPLLFPLMPSERFAQVAYHVSLTFVLAASVYVLCQQRRVLIIAGALFVPTLLSSWSFLIDNADRLAFANNMTNLLFFSYVIVQLLREVFRAPEINREMVSASLCGYLLLGLLWSSAFALLESLQPGSFSGAPLLLGELEADLVYFSFVTLTSLGFGDVLPVTVQAQSLAAFEVVLGQFYMTVLVARLVGMQIAQQTEETIKEVEEELEEELEEKLEEELGEELEEKLEEELEEKLEEKLGKKREDEN